MDKLQEAREIMLEEKQTRTKRVAIAIEELLKKERCKLDISITITQQGNIPNLTIIAED